MLLCHNYVKEEFKMATNPMQKKARNSMLIGIIIGLVIGCAGIAFFFMQAMNYKKQID